MNEQQRENEKRLSSEQLADAILSSIEKPLPTHTEQLREVKPAPPNRFPIEKLAVVRDNMHR